MNSSDNISRQVPLPTPVLVIDEEESTICTFKQSLSSEGFGIDGYTCPIEALEYFTNNHQKYRVLVSAIKMQQPLISGFEVVRRAKTIKPDIKVILLSTFEIKMSEIEKVMPKLSIEQIIQKPVSHEQVLRIARRYLS